MRNLVTRTAIWLVMIKHFTEIMFVAALLAGCATAPPTPGKIAWDGLGRDPNLPLAGTGAKIRPLASNVNSERQSVLAAMRPYSEAWWGVYDEIEAENDRQLNAKLAICRGCLTSGADAVVTGSIHPNEKGPNERR